MRGAHQLIRLPAHLRSPLTDEGLQSRRLGINVSSPKTCVKLPELMPGGGLA